MSSGETTILKRTGAPGGLIDPDRLSGMLMVPVSELAAVLDLRPFGGLAHAEWTSPAVQTRLREIARIIDRVLPWSGSAPQAFVWFRSQPIPSFGRRTAAELARAGRADHLLSHLERIAAGGFA